MSENKQRSKNTPEECAVIVKAWAEGKAIQFKHNDEWKDRTSETAPCFDSFLYKLKPEPRTFSLWTSPDGKSVLQYVASGSDHYYTQSGWTKINVKEIL